MTTLARYELPIIIVAILIGLIVAFWLVRGRGGAAPSVIATPPPAKTVPPSAPPAARRDGAEGNQVTDEFAAATRDVAGEFLGVDAHPDLGGPAGPPDNLQQLKGVGPKLVQQLNAAGITRFDQLARFGPNEISMLDERMGAFRGRVARDRMVEQARYLERGDIEGFEAVFGKLGG
jgi:predicted flap endonuclease-1-like 5' DNA nuclease